MPAGGDVPVLSHSSTDTRIGLQKLPNPAATFRRGLADPICREFPSFLPTHRARHGAKAPSHLIGSK